MTVLVSSSVFISLIVPVRVLAVLLKLIFKSSAFLGDKTLPLFIDYQYQKKNIQYTSIYMINK